MTIEINLPAKNQPLHKAAQRLRWFVGAFEDQVARTSNETGNAYKIDQALLGAVFTDWLNSFNAQKPTDSHNNAAYVGFAAGLMLRTLVRRSPVTLESKPVGADEGNPAYFWPEGYLYVAFCLNARGLVLETDFDEHQHPSRELEDTRTWWSFKENVEQDASLAIAFLDLFAGDEPNWTMPELFSAEFFTETARRFYRHEAFDQLDKKE